MERAKVRNLNENQQDRQAVTVHQVEGKCQIYVYTYCKLTFMFYVSVPEVVLPLQAVVVVVAQARGRAVAYRVPRQPVVRVSRQSPHLAPAVRLACLALRRPRQAV